MYLLMMANFLSKQIFNENGDPIEPLFKKIVDCKESFYWMPEVLQIQYNTEPDFIRN